MESNLVYMLKQQLCRDNSTDCATKRNVRTTTDSFQRAEHCWNDLCSSLPGVGTCDPCTALPNVGDSKLEPRCKVATTAPADPAARGHMSALIIKYTELDEGAKYIN